MGERGVAGRSAGGNVSAGGLRPKEVPEGRGKLCAWERV